MPPVSQSCARCGGSTAWDQSFPPGSKNPEGSWYCPACRCWTAPSDGGEQARRERYVSIAMPIVLSLLAARRKSA
jgi:hypothetical protein